MGYVGAIIALIGAGYSANAQYQQGKTQEAILERNAQQREADARARRLETIAAAKQKRLDDRKLIGRKRLSFLSSGVAIEGSPLEVLAEDAGNLELQTLELQRQGENDIRNMLTKAATDRYEGKAAKKAGKQAAIGTILQGIGMAVGSFSSASSSGRDQTKASQGSPGPAAGSSSSGSSSGRTF